MVEEDKQLPRSRYSLSELEDLESRLVLISGENSQKQEEVDAYLKVRHKTKASAIDICKSHNKNYCCLIITVFKSFMGNCLLKV